MMKQLVLVAGLVLAFAFSSCKTTGSSTNSSTPGTGSEINLDLRGHQYYTRGQYDSASAVYKRLLKLDPENKIALRDMGGMHFELAKMDKDEKSPERVEHLRASRRYFSDLEGLGEHDPELYDRLCELALALGDKKAFLSYAIKSADLYPFDRQYYNLGIGYFNVGDYQNVIKVEKAAIEKFRTSPYMSSYYRQLGRAYMKMDRDQTAERTFEDGLRIANERLGGRTSPDDFRRLMDDKIAMLLSLRQLCQTYHKDDKLKQVQRELQEAGYSGK